jgi:DNA-binding NtrC family response regulator
MSLPADVLIVEDDPLIALDFEETVLELGVGSARTASTVARACELIAERAPDFAFLDVELMREKSFVVAEKLEALGVPFAFVTGHARESIFPAKFSQRPILPKPYPRDALENLLRDWRGVNEGNAGG